VTRANPGLIRALLTQGVLPVVSSIGASASGALFNINADTAAAAIASAVRAPELRFFTDVEGLLDQSGNVVSQLDTKGLEAMLESPAVSGGMKPKLHAALSALKGGVRQITIGLPPTANRQQPTEGGTTLVAA
jgi:acetylglutamate kinase